MIRKEKQSAVDEMSVHRMYLRGNTPCSLERTWKQQQQQQQQQQVPKTMLIGEGDSSTHTYTGTHQKTVHTLLPEYIQISVI